MLIHEFDSKFKHLFTGGFPRWEAFRFIAEKLISLNRPLSIIETGSLRTENDWNGNGQSTLIWDWLIEKLGGECHSIDINPEVSEFAKKHTKFAKIINKDSILALRNSTLASVCDLLYLDSYDWSEQSKIESPLHHIGELAATWGRLPSGCIVAVDDCHSENFGKHVMVKAFFEYVGKAPTHSGYITVWEK